MMIGNNRNKECSKQKKSKDANQKKYPQTLTHFLAMSLIKMMKEIRNFFNSVGCLENSIEDNVFTLPLFQKAVVSK